jgi:phenylalanyl-tRNA synthetase alpha chain
VKSSQDEVHPLWDEFCRDLETVSGSDELTDLKDKYLSRNRGLVTLELKNLKGLSPQDRSEAGRQLNQLKGRVQAALSERQAEFKEREHLLKLETEQIDVTLPGYDFLQGGLHPLRHVWREMEEISVRMGFTVVSGPEVESDYYNFEALNIPKGHPARDDQDTFYLSHNLLLRTHTSPVQIRTMENQSPPIRIVVPGRVYRRDAADTTHTPMFHQMEGLLVDEGITLADLKGTLEVFLKELFSADTRVRFRPSYFPFVEPGAEVDISCIFCAGEGCRVCKGSGWIEIMGAGMVHPRVFEMVGYDSEKYTGFAWGMGIDRIAQLKFQVDDSRLFYENDIRFLRQF